MIPDRPDILDPDLTGRDYFLGTRITRIKKWKLIFPFREAHIDMSTWF